MQRQNLVSIFCLLSLLGCEGRREPIGTLATDPNTESGSDETTVLGMDSMHLCLLPTEFADPFVKMAAPLALRGRLEEGRFGSGSLFPEVRSPFVKIQYLDRQSGQWRDAVGSEKVGLEVSEWSGFEGQHTQYRQLSFRGQIKLDSDHEVSANWGFLQERLASEPHTLTTLKVQLADLNWIDHDQLLRYGFMNAPTDCDQDAYQGEQPGTIFGLDAVADDSRKPYAQHGRYEALPGSRAQVVMDGRTSIGGFDKTMFVSVDSFEVAGLLPRAFSAKGAAEVIQVASHHNWHDTYLVNLMNVRDLSEAEKKELRSQKVFYVQLRKATEAETGASENAWKTYALETLGQDHQPLKVLGLTLQK